MDGAVHTYKARLVAKGFTQTPGIDYKETFSPVADIRASRILIAISAFYDYEIWQMGVKTAFLNGFLNEEVYIEQPEGFVSQKFPNRICKLKHSIYGLKQASRQWNKRFDDEIKKFGFSQNRDEPCVYVKASRSYVTFLILYVDDILIMGNNIPMLQDVKSYLGRCFAMKDLGESAYILGIKINRDRSKRLIGLCQSAYIKKILKIYMDNSKRGTIPMQEKLKFSKSQGASTPAEIQRMQNIPYASAVGSIMYAVRCTRPDVAFAQNITSRFQQNPGDAHWTAVKNILKVSCYTDAGYLTDADDMKSQTGYVFVLNGGVVDWKSTKQSIFATSSTDAEYIAAFDASKEAVWIRKFISGLGVVPTIEEPINMYCDNTGAIAIAKDHGVTKGARHFRAKVHYLRETIEMGDVRIEKVDTDDNLADPFTKALAFPKHSELTEKIGMIPATLQVTILDACNKGFYKGVSLADDDTNVSLIQYADDALFFGKWSSSNAKNLILILNCFEEASGLKVNLSKSRLFGIGVDLSEVEDVASSLNCSHDSIPFLYLGLPVGKNMKYLMAGLMLLGEKDTLWRDIIISIDYIDGLDVPFSSSFSKKVSNGFDTRFWKDVCCIEGIRLMDKFPRLYALESNKDCKVSDRWVLSDGVWRGNWDWRSPLRGRSSDELSFLVSVINNLCFTSTSLDKWYWSLDPSGCFKVNTLTK
ncbi:retrotransposon protein, putative, ty1-copia subclass [Tanacetum coccineum]